MTENSSSAKPSPAGAASEARRFAQRAVDPTDAVAPDGMEDAPAVVINGITVDLDDREMPSEIEDRAFSSGRHPYADKLGGKAYEERLVPLQIELLKLQNWVKKTGERVAIVFEGRDGAGKGGAIKTVTEHLNPRSVKIVALAKPSPEEAGQWYFQRYLKEMPSGGQIVLFDRSWYNRAVVEPVFGFATPEQTARFLQEAPRVERLLVEDGVRLFKFWLTVGREMQIKRLHDRRHDPLKRWKLSPIDYAGLDLWEANSAAAERMLRETHSEAAPWSVVKANDKKRARLEIIRSILLAIPYAGRDLAAIGELDGRIMLDAPAFLAEGGES